MIEVVASGVTSCVVDGRPIGGGAGSLEVNFSPAGTAPAIRAAISYPFRTIGIEISREEFMRALADVRGGRMGVQTAGRAGTLPSLDPGSNDPDPPGPRIEAGELCADLIEQMSRDAIRIRISLKAVSMEIDVMRSDLEPSFVRAMGYWLIATGQVMP